MLFSGDYKSLKSIKRFQNRIAAMRNNHIKKRIIPTLF